LEDTPCRTEATRNRTFNPPIICVDLFCGVGGLTHGLIRGGVSVVAGVDLDPTCLYPYESNNNARFVNKDIHGLSGEDLSTLFGPTTGLRLLAGCAPCQPFSTYSRKGRCGRHDSKWELVADFGRLVEATRPELVSMENVPQLADHDVFAEFLERLAGYEVWWEKVSCERYGVPQTRTRLVLLASRLGPVSLIPPTSAMMASSTVRAAISHLPTLAAGASDPNDPLHVASSLNDLNMRRVRASTPGGTWRDWDSSLMAGCHRKDSGQTYPSVYGRMEWDRPAPTVTTQCFGYGNGRFGHPEQDRAISLREAAILQTFPDTYRFVPPANPVRFNVLGRLIGNAVPVRIGEAVAQSLVEHVHVYADV